MQNLLHRITSAFCLFVVFFQYNHAASQAQETLPPIVNGKNPHDFESMWSGFDPRKEPLETEVLHQWEEDEVILRIVRFRIGIFKGERAMLAGVYGFPKHITAPEERLPGLLQIHGGGQYSDHRACLMNAKRGYATLSIAWAGRISAPDYRVGPETVKLFWDGKQDDPVYKITTDWGAVDGYHAPGRNPGNVFPSAKPADWTLDDIESPRNSGWFLCALAARRSLTFLEQQPEVDPERLGVYGHSMGGKLTVMTAIDSRVKAAAPSCGGISDRYNDSAIFRSTLGDDVSLKNISCPIIFLSPANDFHGRIGNLPSAIEEIKTNEWRVTCSPHHNHQDTPEYEAVTLLWFDMHLKGNFHFPRTPKGILTLNNRDGIPSFTVQPDTSRKVISVDVYYTQQGKSDERPQEREHTMHRFWHHATAVKTDGQWIAKLPVHDTDHPLWVYANVTYGLDQPVSGAGYYYGSYTASTFNVSSLLQMISSEELKQANIQPALKQSSLIESFEEGWEKEWFSYRPEQWARTTHKIYDPMWKAPHEARLTLKIQSDEPNTLVVLIDDHAAEIKLPGGETWQEVTLNPDDFLNVEDNPLPGWDGIGRLKISPKEVLRPGRGSTTPPKTLGGQWAGSEPTFRNLRWK
jgi:hypothetical protein